MIKIGEYKILFHSSLLVPEDESATIVIKDDDGDETTLRIIFLVTPKENANEKPEPVLSIREVNNVGEITFTNWGRGFGNSTKKPVAFADGPDGLELSFMANVSKLGSVYRLEFQVMTRIVK